MITKKLWASRKDNWNNEEKVIKTSITVAEEEVGNLIRRLAKTKDDEIAAEFEEEIKRQKARLVDRRIELEKYISAPPDYDRAFALVSTIIKNPYLYWDNGSDIQKRTVHRMVFTVPPSYDRDKGFSTVDLTLPHLISTTTKTDSSNLVEVAGESWHHFINEILRWFTMLAV